MKYTTIITDRDPTLEGCQTHLSLPPCTSKLDAYSDCRHYSKQFGGFGSVYDDAGESLLEIDWTEKEENL
jgi:hypothetical protein